MIDQLAVARVRKENNNVKVSPVDLLQTVIADLQDGNAKADGLIILLVDRAGDAWETERYRCGMTRADELAFITLCQDLIIRKWRKD